MNRKIVAGLTAAAVAVALSACAGGSASGGASGSGGPADDSTRYKRPDRSGPLSPDSASAPATGTVSASSGGAASSSTIR